MGLISTAAVVGFAFTVIGSVIRGRGCLLDSYLPLIQSYGEAQAARQPASPVNSW